MKNILKNSILIISEIFIIFLAILWYYKEKEIEPLIVIISVSTTLIVGIIFKSNIMKNDILKSENLSIDDVKGKKGVDIDIDMNSGNINLNKVESKKGKTSIIIKQK